ncbi:hypothetical protein [Arthrobacter woluwensis]|uniref:hypothetical protein n=1 Tax=Arthrobacter woluwensis TaxID=156980 RepID=UPI00119ED4CB|nr:hypothetical protein [Arthrobacter woluwensis]
MDLLLILGSACAIIAFAFTVWMLFIGSMTARPPEWEVSFQCLAALEARERGLLQRPRSESDEHALQDLVGTRWATSDTETHEIKHQALESVTDATSEDFEGLRRLQDLHLQRALNRQTAITQKFTNVRIAAKVWNAVYILNSTIIVGVGLRWFFPLFFSRTRRIGEKYLSTATFLGVWAGLLWWAWTHFDNASTQTDWLSLVGVVITLSTVLGLVAAIGRQLTTLLTTLRGPRTAWTRKGIIVGAMLLILFSSLFGALYTGAYTRWSLAVTRWALDQIDRLNLGATIGAILMIGFLAYIIRNGIQWTRLKVLRFEDRISFGAATALFAVVAYFILIFLVKAPSGFYTAGLWVFGMLIFASALIFITVQSVETFRDLRFLRESGMRIPRRGFRWWLLLTWFGLFIGGFITSFAFNPTLRSAFEPALTIFELAAVLGTLLASVMFIPGLIVTLLYIRRIRAVRRRSSAVPVTPEVARETIPATSSEAIALGYIIQLDNLNSEGNFGAEASDSGGGL